MKYLYENQNIDFDDVRRDLIRLFGPGHSAVIHDGDACNLFTSVAGSYCAGAVTNESGNRVATFAIDYVCDETPTGDFQRHVLAIHIGPVGQWCRSLDELSPYNDWFNDLSSQYPAGSC